MTVGAVDLDLKDAFGFLAGLSRPGLARQPGLERIRRLLELLGHPENGLRTVHITGTNGKGSTAAAVSSICRAAGLRTGLFISPYLQRFGERIQFDGEELRDEWVVQLVDRIRPSVRQMEEEGTGTPTEFEAVTAMAALYYRERGTDVVVLEAGMGGLRDATNAIPGSLVAVITSVGLDHTERLGATVEAIAREKSGIIRPGGAVVTGQLRPEAAAAVAAAAQAQGAKVLALGTDFHVHVATADDRGLVCTVRTRQASYLRMRFPLLGRHQAANVAVAVAVAEHLASCGFPIDSRSIRTGIQTTAWPGRSEIFSRSPLVVLDGGHNPDALAALAATLREVFPRQRILAILAGMADKDLAAMFAQLAPLISRAITTSPPFTPRAIASDQLAVMLRERFPGLPVEAEPDLEAAMRRGLSRINGDVGAPTMLLVAGSFYLVGAARNFLERYLPQPGRP